MRDAGKPGAEDLAMRFLLWDLPPATTRRRLVERLLVVGGIVGAVAILFLYDAGFIGPRRLSPSAFVDTFEDANGHNEGFRRNHAKGVGLLGEFQSNGRGAALSKAAVFAPGSVPVLGRFSFGPGGPHAPDDMGVVRGLGLQFQPATGGEWRTAMVSLPVFPASTPQTFHDLIVATMPDPSTRHPDPARVQAFLAQHPDTAKALQRIKSQPPAAGFEDTTYNSLNAFFFTDASGRRTPVRWSLVPESSPAVAGATPHDTPNFLFDRLIAKEAARPLRWRLVVTVGQPGDPTDNPTVEWPADRERVDVGTLTVNRIESEETSPARDLVFDPLVLPAGIEASDDPVLNARSGVYAESFRRRAGESPKASAVTPAEVDVAPGAGGRIP
jgi:catalase